jgi:hypothetical protein
MFGEFEKNYLEFTRTIIGLVELSEKEKLETEQYFFKMFTSIDRIVTNVTTANILNKFIFLPLIDISQDLETVLDLKNSENSAKYSCIREKLCIYLNYLKPKKNCTKELFIQKYINNTEYEKNILFVSNFNDKSMIKLSQLIVDSCNSNNALLVFSSKTLFKETKNCIIDASEINVTPEAKSMIISSTIEASKHAQIKKIFSEVLLQQDNESHYLVKMHGNERILMM